MPAGAGPAFGPMSRERVLETLGNEGVTVTIDPDSGRITLRKGRALIANILLEDRVPEMQLRHFADNFGFHWLKFHNPNLELELGEVPVYDPRR